MADSKYHTWHAYRGAGAWWEERRRLERGSAYSFNSHLLSWEWTGVPQNYTNSKKSTPLCNDFGDAVSLKGSTNSSYHNIRLRNIIHPNQQMKENGRERRRRRDGGVPVEWNVLTKPWRPEGCVVIPLWLPLDQVAHIYLPRSYLGSHMGDTSNTHTHTHQLILKCLG